MLKIIVHGLGRLGQTVCKIAAESNEYKIVAGIDSAPKASFVFPVYANLDECIKEADVVVDCSVASAVSNLVCRAQDKKIPVVVCTTALDDEIRQVIHNAAGHIPIFLSANMALGVNLMSKISQIAAKVLSEAGFDIEIIEKHHNGKIDAPSGTANMLANEIVRTLGSGNLVHDRSGRRHKRQQGEIGMHSIRGGSIAGEHTILFAGEGETLEIKHTALSGEVFARGVLRAAKFVATKPVGLYGMDDLLK